MRRKLLSFLHKKRTILRGWLLSDALILNILGVEMIITGVDYLTKTFRSALHSYFHPIEQVLTPEISGALWVAIGLACVISALAPRGKFASIAVGVGVGINIVWAASTLLANIFLMRWVYGFGDFIRFISIAILVSYIVWLKEILRRNQAPSPEEVSRVLHGDNP